MSAVVAFAFMAAALSVVAGKELYRHAYSYPGSADRTREAKESFERVILALTAVVVTAVAEVVMGASYAPVVGMASVLLYVAAFITVGAILGGLVLGHLRGKRKLIAS